MFGVENASGTPIYVHAETCVVDVVDGRRDGREPAGLDAGDDRAQVAARALRTELLAEHLRLGVGEPSSAHRRPPPPVGPLRRLLVAPAYAGMADPTTGPGANGAPTAGDRGRPLCCREVAQVALSARSWPTPTIGPARRPPSTERGLMQNPNPSLRATGRRRASTVTAVLGFAGVAGAGAVAMAASGGTRSASPAAVPSTATMSSTAPSTMSPTAPSTAPPTTDATAQAQVQAQARAAQGGSVSNGSGAPGAVSSGS